MSTSEIVMLQILCVLRCLFILALVVLPIIILVNLFSSIASKRRKGILISVLSLLLVGVLGYLALGSFVVKPRIDIDSFRENKEQFLSLDLGYYEFEAEHVRGQIQVYHNDGSEDVFTDGIIKTYDLGNETNCSISWLRCPKDVRLSHLWQPESANGTILIQDDKKIIDIYYWYEDKNFATFFWFITNPEIIYKKEIVSQDISDNIIFESNWEDWLEE